MAIQFTRIEITNRKNGGNACRKGAYNARSAVIDEKTNTSYNFSDRSDNVYHDILLPDGVNKKFKNVAELMNSVELAEKKSNSQLLKDIVIALPDDQELSLQDRINITHEIIEEMAWVKNGLAVQVDIHEPHDGEHNWHAHLLVLTRRFTEDGNRLGEKARDLNPEFKTGVNGNFIVPEEDIIHERGKRIINQYFEKLGLENRVDDIGLYTQEHAGPTRMRNSENKVVQRNEERVFAEKEALKDPGKVIERVTRSRSVFKESDLIRLVRYAKGSDPELLIKEILQHESVIPLVGRDGSGTGYYTTSKIRQEELEILRQSNKVANNINIFTEEGRENIVKNLLNVLSDNSRVAEEDLIYESNERILKKHFEKLAAENRSDEIEVNSQDYIASDIMGKVIKSAIHRHREYIIVEKEDFKDAISVINNITKNSSVFKKSDLMRLVRDVKNLDPVQLVEEVLAHKSIVPLIVKDSGDTGYYTTIKVRKEELKVLRHSYYVVNNKNVFTDNAKKGRADIVKGFVESAREQLTEEQLAALTTLVTSDSGIGILRGRAGAGKSHVLKQIANIAKESGIKAIGLAPTHKAKQALNADGFESVKTIKSFLFQLVHGKIILPKNSLLVVDEAGMVGNDDYQELMRVAAMYKSHVILSGDERQIASVGRGDMFMVFAEKYGSSIISTIKRQQNNWGRAVATAFSQGEVETGVQILSEESRIKWHSDLVITCKALLSDWYQSKYDLKNRLILTVKNEHVVALNHGARQYLKADGTLTGPEIQVGQNRYMKGDRIIIQKTDKKLGLTNGDLGELIEVSKDKFVFSMICNKSNKEHNRGKDQARNQSGDKGGSGRIEDNIKIVEFNPNNYSGFRHGYATTIFKAQGASIKAVFVYHGGFSGLKNSYVALSRNIFELNLYVNSSITKGISSLIKQLKENIDYGSSLGYFTAQEYEDSQKPIEITANKSALENALHSAYKFATTNVIKTTDKFFPSLKYYIVKEPEEKVALVSEVNEATDGAYLEGQDAKSNNRLQIDNYARNQYLPRVQAEYQHDNYEDKSQEQYGQVVGSRFIEKDTEQMKMSNNTKPVEPGKLEIKIAAERKQEAAEEVQNTTQNTTRNQPHDTPHKQAQVKDKVKISAKEQFYQKADAAKNKNKTEKPPKVEKIDLKPIWEEQTNRLRHETTFRAESIARDLLGEPNKKLSNGKALRFGTNGKMSVHITGSKAGQWYDFSDSRGGDMFSLIQEKLGCDFKGAIEYLGGNTNYDSVQLVQDHRNSNLTEKYLKEKQAEAKTAQTKQAKVDKLYDRSKNIMNRSTAYHYLDKHRGIQCALGEDLKTAGIYTKINNKENASYEPALIAFARDAKGEVTGGQQILLDKKTYGKADVDLPKKSFGKIAGSFVEVSQKSQITDKFITDKITIIAEGLETALSIKQALDNDPKQQDRSIKILCSLGISNIENYHPEANEIIIIAADNDGANANTNKTIDNAKLTLEQRCAQEGISGHVEVVRPSTEGDFNDMLKGNQNNQGRQGEKEIQAIFNQAIGKQLATTVNEYLNYSGEWHQLTPKHKKDLIYISEFKIDEKSIVEEFKKDFNRGISQLVHIRVTAELTNSRITQHQKLIKEANSYGAKLDHKNLTKDLFGMNHDEIENHLTSIKDKYYNINHLNQLKQNKCSAKTIDKTFEAIKQEQAFLAGLNGNIDHQDYSNQLQDRVKNAHEMQQDNGLYNLKKAAHYAYKAEIISKDDLHKELKSDQNIDVIHNNINSICYKHHCNILNDHCKKLIEGEEIMHRGNKFDNVVEYLEHWKENIHHQMLPIKRMDQIIEQQKQAHLDYHHSLEL